MKMEQHNFAKSLKTNNNNDNQEYRYEVTAFIITWCVAISDGFGSKFFVLTLVGSGQFFAARVGPGQPFMVWVRI